MRFVTPIGSIFTNSSLSSNIFNWGYRHSDATAFAHGYSTANYFHTLQRNGAQITGNSNQLHEATYLFHGSKPSSVVLAMGDVMHLDAGAIWTNGSGFTRAQLTCPMR